MIKIRLSLSYKLAKKKWQVNDLNFSDSFPLSLVCEVENRKLSIECKQGRQMSHRHLRGKT